MDLNKLIRDDLEAVLDLLPGPKVATVYSLKLADGSVYVSTSNHLSYRLYQVTLASQGKENTASAAIQRHGGVSQLLAYTVVATEAQATATAERWTDLARKRGKVATDTLQQENREQGAREAFTTPEQRGDF